jgi:hypothetical protein
MEYYELPLPEPTLKALSELRRLDREGPGYGATSRAWNNLLLWLGRRAASEGLSADDLLEQGKQLRELFLDLRAALNEHYREHRWSENEKPEESGSLFEDFPPGYFETKGLKRCPIDLETLKEATQAYLRLPMLSNPTFDWLIINGYLRHFVEEYWELLLSGRAFGQFNWSYLVSGGKPQVMLLLRTIGGLLAAALNWLAFPALALYFVSAGRLGWAAAFAVLTVLQLVIRLASIPSQIRTARKRRHKAAALGDLMDLKYYAGSALWNPTDLLARVRRFEVNHPNVYLMPISSILARAVQRDPDVLEFWTANDNFVAPLRGRSKGAG